MRIALDETHDLVSDQYCCWVEQKRHSKNGTEYTVVITGYYRTLARLFEDYINRRFMGSTVEQIKDLSDDVEKLKKEMAAFAKGLEVLL